MRNFLKKIWHLAKEWSENILYLSARIKSGLSYLVNDKKINKINIGGADMHIEGYFNIDKNPRADLVLDLSKHLFPFPSDSIDVAICISAINYFTRERGEKIIKDAYRVLKPGGVARFGTQDFKAIAKKYVENDTDFFFQKNPDGRERFRGETRCDKINSWFYGYKSAKNRMMGYFYDYETLALLFKKAGFSKIEQKNYRQSQIENIEMIDNRPDQMFFLEAVK